MQVSVLCVNRACFLKMHTVDLGLSSANELNSCICMYIHVCHATDVMHPYVIFCSEIICGGNMLLADSLWCDGALFIE